MPRNNSQENDDGKASGSTIRIEKEMGTPEGKAVGNV
jgi:hypothetical protein